MTLGCCPAGMLLPSHEEIFCSCSIKAICVSLPAGRDPARGKKSSGCSRGSSTGWGQHGDGGVPLLQGGHGLSPCPFLLLPCPAPMPGRTPTKMPWQIHSPPPQSPVPHHPSGAQFTGEAGTGCRNAFHLWPADPWPFPAATPVLG